MDRAIRTVIAPIGSYEVDSRCYSVGSDQFDAAVVSAHSVRQRPRCLCRPGGVEMYVARLGLGLIVKRMPETGDRHAPDCPSYQPPAAASGLRQVLGSAIVENPATGETSLKLDFAMLKLPGHSGIPPVGAESDSAASGGSRLSLRGLLHYLWDQSELTRWQPAFAGRRTWGVVRRHLIQAAAGKSVGGAPLGSRLFIPEPFSVDQRDAIEARRSAQWAQAAPVPGKPQRLMLLVAEVKEIVPARYGAKAVAKHLPDQALGLDDQLYRRLGRRFEPALTMWSTDDDIHMMMIATFSLSASGVPTVHELSLMPVTRHWIPVEDAFEKRLVERLVHEGRSFVKGLRYNMGAADTFASATLIDCEYATPLLFIGGRMSMGAEREANEAAPPASTWSWQPALEAMPPLPPRKTSKVSLPHPISAAGRSPSRAS